MGCDDDMYTFSISRVSKTSSIVMRNILLSLCFSGSRSNFI